MIFEKGGDKGSRHEEVSGKCIPGKGNSNAKDMKNEEAWQVQGRARRSECLEKIEG